MRQDAAAALRNLKLGLIALFGAEVELRLCGSVARGGDRDYSDIDVLVLLPGTSITRSRNGSSTPLATWSCRHGVALGVVVYEEAFWDCELAAGMFLQRSVAREGPAA